MAQKTDIEPSLISSPLSPEGPVVSSFIPPFTLPKTITPSQPSKKAKNRFHVTFHPPPPNEAFCEQRELVEEMVQRELPQLTFGIPIVYCSPPIEGQFLFSACCIAENLPELLHTSPDLLSPNLPPGVTITSTSVYRILFSVDALLDRQFLFIYNAIAFDDSESFHAIKENASSLRDSIILSLKLPALCQQLKTIKTTHPNKTSLLLLQKSTRWLAHHRSKAPAALIEEVQRFLFATDADFQGIRTPNHLFKLISSHLFLKEKHCHLTSTRGSEKWFYYRLFPTKLQFPFGSKDVLCLVISLHSLSTYEQFDHRHILLACKRCLPCLDVVPRSFYMYRYAEEPTLSLYVELEKHDGSALTRAEIDTLKLDLGDELSASIEQVMSRIEIPQNEEDLLRNFLLLSQQIKTTKCLPYAIVQFQGQSDETLEFHVTIVRAVKKEFEAIPLPSPVHPGIRQCTVLRSSIVDTLRTTYVKQGIVFLVECSKEHFLRRDRSVDFLKARESVVRCIESALGEVHDVNGGIVYQQHQLLDSVTPLLTKEEAKEVSLIEDLFQSLPPSAIKEILGPEHVATLFRQLLSLRKSIRKQKEHVGSVDVRQGCLKTFLAEEYAKELFIGFIVPSDFVQEEIFQAQLHCQLADDEIAVCDMVVEGQRLCFVICVHQDSSVRERFIKSLKEKIHDRRRARGKNSLRISLSCPTVSLDPRIGTDRTSGTVIKMLYEGLMRLDPSGTPAPAIAEEVLISDNGTTYTFKLRSTFWTNGRKVTAHDFEYAWKKILDPSFQTAFDYLLHPILNARFVKAGRLSADSLGIHAINDSMLIVHLEKPAPHFLELCCLWIYSPLCHDLDTTDPGWSYYRDLSYVCNGPFKLIKRSRNGDMELAKNELYWDQENVAIEHVDIKVIEDPHVALTMYEQGELDWLGEPLSETPLCLFKEKNPRVHTQPMAAVEWFGLNVLHPPFRSEKVRKALSYALDRKELIKELLYGDERPSHSILPPSLSLLKDQTPLSFDLEKAQRLFEEGMEEQGLLISLLKPLKVVVYDQEPHKSVARAVIRALEKAFGLSFTLEVLSWHDFFDCAAGTSHDILGHVWYSWYQDPLYTLKVLQSSSNSMNSSNWSSEEYARLLDSAEAEGEKRQRTLLLQKAEELVMEQMPIIPIFDYTSRYLKSNHIENVYVTHLGNVDFKWTTFVDEEERSSESCSQPSLPTKEVHLYLQSEPFSLDPRDGGDRRSQIVIRELFEGLYRIGRDGKLKPGLAESVSISEDQTVYTFHLRPSKWSNGTDVSAEDFVFAIQSLLSPTFSTPYAYAFFPIKNARKARLGECSLEQIGCVAQDAKTLLITLERPTPYFLSLTSNPVYSPISKANAEKNPNWRSEVFPKYVSNGPFVLKSHTQRSELVLEKNPYYWDADGAKSERLSFRIIKDPGAAFHMFESGTLDWYGDPCGNMSKDSFAKLQMSKALLQRQGGGTSWLICRTDLPHLCSAKIRKAIALAINRKEICESLMEGGEFPSLSLLPPFLTLSDTTTLEDNAPEKARALFEEGVADIGSSDAAYPPLLLSHSADTREKAVAKIVQNQLIRNLGIQVITCLLDSNSYIKRTSEGDFQLMLAKWFSWFPDPIFTFQLLKFKDSGFNGSRWENPEYIRLLDLSDSAGDAEQRLEYLKRAEAIVMSDLPIIPLYYQIDTYIKAPHLVGEAVSPVGLIEMKWLEKSS